MRGAETPECHNFAFYPVADPSHISPASAEPETVAADHGDEDVGQNPHGTKPQMFNQLHIGKPPPDVLC